MRTIVPGVRTLVLNLTLCLLSFSTFSQSVSTLDGKLEIGAGIGPLFFLGDLGGNLGRGSTFVKDINFPVTKMCKGFNANFYPNEWIGIRIAFNQGQLEGADSLIREKGGEEITRKVRNLHFRSKLVEGYGALEIYPTIFMEKYDGLALKLRPYVVVGYGVFHYNPQAQYFSPNGQTKWVDLRPLRLEGQGMAEYPNRPMYSLTQKEFLLGTGIKYYITETFFIGFEILHRKTFTDYVDDVSKDFIDPSLFDKYLTPEQSAMANQMFNRGFSNLTRPTIGEPRGNPKNNDAFFSSILKFGWRLVSDRTPQSLLCPKL
jgi:hypothetical protein